MSKKKEVGLGGGRSGKEPWRRLCHKVSERGHCCHGVESAPCALRRNQHEEGIDVVKGRRVDGAYMTSAMGGSTQRKEEMFEKF